MLRSLKFEFLILHVLAFLKFMVCSIHFVSKIVRKKNRKAQAQPSMANPLMLLVLYKKEYIIMSVFNETRKRQLLPFLSFASLVGTGSSRSVAAAVRTTQSQEISRTDRKERERPRCVGKTINLCDSTTSRQQAGPSSTRAAAAH